MPTFAELTTIATGGPVGRYVPVHTTDALIAAVADADAAGEPVLLIGGGSNLIVADAGFVGVTVHVGTRGIGADGDLVTVAAGENWDGFVAAMLAEGRGQFAAMAGIPGTVGATPVQNVGAYGVTVSQLLETITAYDRITGSVLEIACADCRFGNRTSIFKGGDRYVITQVSFRLPVTETIPVASGQVARVLGARIGDEVPAERVREAVLALRPMKGLLLDADDPDTRGVGAFFVNPIVDEVPSSAAGLAVWTDPAGHKLSAASLIEQAGFGKGYGAEVGTGRARLSGKLASAIVTSAGATTDDVLTLARRVRDGVRRRFGVDLEPEADLVGCAL